MPRRSILARDKETAQAVKLSLQGATQREIAEQLGVNQATISNDLRHARRCWAQALVGDLQEVKAQELERLEYVEVEAVRAWERSKRDPDNPSNPKYLDTLVKASVRKARLLGLDAPLTRHDHVIEYDPDELKVRLERYSATFSIPAISAPARDD
jgi:Zn-dependent M32 family carboxypeptidase